MKKGSIPRREFLKVASAASVAGAGLTPSLPATAPAAAQATPPTSAPSQAAPEVRLILTEPEAAFFGAAADTIIPADELSPSGSDCGLVTFIDRQLASAWGGGARMYRSGPFHQGTPEQGYQLALTPRDFFAAGIAAANEWCTRTYEKAFDRLTPAQRTEALKAMEEGKAAFKDFDSRLFFQRLLTINMEGFFSDPIYGGNRNKAAWKMLQFPGLPATYATKIDEYRNKRYIAEPQSIEDFS
jgi:gluconate 2-dehydrogenase gamma chain